MSSDRLSDDAKSVLKHKATEVPGTGALLHNNGTGQYLCGNCQNLLFKSDSKYDSRTPGLIGWPSFDNSVEGAVEFKVDDSYGMIRTEVTCKNCQSHLGHIFDADDSATGKHFCINSKALCFEGEDGTKIEG